MRHDGIHVEKPEAIKARHDELLLELNQNEVYARKTRKVIYILCLLVVVDICVGVYPLVSSFIAS